MADRTQYMREYKRKQRAQAKPGQVCIICGSTSDPARKPRKGNKTCDICQQDRNEHPKHGQYVATVYQRSKKAADKTPKKKTSKKK